MLNYETEWMTREDIVLSSYEASLELNRLKARHGLMSAEELSKAEERTTSAQELIELLDDLGELNDQAVRELKPRMEEINSIVSRPRNDWELGLRLGKWGLLRRGYFLVAQAVIAFFSQLRRTARKGAKETTPSFSGSER